MNVTQCCFIPDAEIYCTLSDVFQVIQTGHTCSCIARIFKRTASDDCKYEIHMDEKKTRFDNLETRTSGPSQTASCCFSSLHTYSQFIFCAQFGYSSSMIGRPSNACSETHCFRKDNILSSLKTCNMNLRASAVSFLIL